MTFSSADNPSHATDIWSTKFPNNPSRVKLISKFSLWSSQLLPNPHTHYLKHPNSPINHAPDPTIWSLALANLFNPAVTDPHIISLIFSFLTPPHKSPVSTLTSHIPTHPMALSKPLNWQLGMHPSDRVSIFLAFFYLPSQSSVPDTSFSFTKRTCNACSEVIETFDSNLQFQFAAAGSRVRKSLAQGKTTLFHAFNGSLQFLGHWAFT